jgi:hypothetical protein
LLLTFFLIAFFSSSTADASAFGEDCHMEIQTEDNCHITRVVCHQKFFWITVYTTVDLVEINCPPARP